MMPPLHMHLRTHTFQINFWNIPFYIHKISQQFFNHGIAPDEVYIDKIFTCRWGIRRANLATSREPRTFSRTASLRGSWKRTVAAQWKITLTLDVKMWMSSELNARHSEETSPSTATSFSKELSSRIRSKTYKNIFSKTNNYYSQYIINRL